jgi:hypothetical protein
VLRDVIPHVTLNECFVGALWESLVSALLCGTSVVQALSVSMAVELAKTGNRPSHDFEQLFIRLVCGKVLGVKLDDGEIPDKSPDAGYEAEVRKFVEQMANCELDPTRPGSFSSRLASAVFLLFPAPRWNQLSGTQHLRGF